MDDLVLDPSIRDWVLIPIFVIMFLMGILRNNVTKMMKSADVRSPACCAARCPPATPRGTRRTGATSGRRAYQPLLTRHPLSFPRRFWTRRRCSRTTS